MGPAQGRARTLRAGLQERVRGNALEHQAVLRPGHSLDLCAQENALTSLFGYRKTTGWMGTPGMNAPVDGEGTRLISTAARPPPVRPGGGLSTEWASQSEVTGGRLWTLRPNPRVAGDRYENTSGLRHFAGSKGLPHLLTDRDN